MYIGANRHQSRGGLLFVEADCKKQADHHFQERGVDCCRVSAPPGRWLKRNESAVASLNESRSTENCIP